MANIYIGPQRFVGGIHTRPEGEVTGALRLTGKGQPRLGLFTINGTLPSEYTKIGTGDIRETRSTAGMKSAWESLLGYKPRGDTVGAMMFNHFTAGSDPTYSGGLAPLIPNSKGELVLSYYGTRIKVEPFRLGLHDHTSNVLDSLHRTYSRQQLDVEAGRMSANHLRRILDRNIEKYRLDKRSKASWEVLVPQEFRSDHEGPLPHRTTIDDDFNRGNADALGTSSDGDWSWIEYTNALSGGASTAEDAWDVLDSTALSVDTSGAKGNLARAEKDLSSDDVRCQFLISDIANSNDQLGPAVRFENGGDNNNFYMARAQQVNDLVEITTLIDGTLNDLGTGVAQTPAGGDTLKFQVNGSELKSFYNGVELASETDTNITGNLRCGLYGFVSGGSPNIDNFQAADLPVGLTQGAWKTLVVNQAVQRAATY